MIYRRSSRLSLSADRFVVDEREGPSLRLHRQGRESLRLWASQRDDPDLRSYTGFLQLLRNAHNCCDGRGECLLECSSNTVREFRRAQEISSNLQCSHVRIRGNPLSHDFPSLDGTRLFLGEYQHDRNRGWPVPINRDWHTTKPGIG